MTAPATASPRIEVLARLDPDEVTRVALLVERATEVDGKRPLSEHVALHLRHGGDEGVRHILAYLPSAAGEKLAGYAHLDVTDEVEGPSAELVVDPEYRNQGVGRQLVSHLVAESAGGRLRLWSRGESPAAARMKAMGFEQSRSLWRMRRNLSTPLPNAQLPAGVTIRTFLPGIDDMDWIVLNARAFAKHPEQGLWTLKDLHHRMAEPWFEPAGFFLAERSIGGRASLVGFHWTKIHGGDHLHTHSTDAHDSEAPESHTDEVHGHEPIGEVYVVGVDPAEQSHGLGRALTIVGLNYLRAKGLKEAML